MAYKRNPLVDLFLLTHKKDIIDNWYNIYYTQTNEYQLHSKFDEFGENLKAEIHYLFEQSVAHKFSAVEMRQEHRHFGENRAAISTSLEDISKMTFSMEEYVINFLHTEMEKGNLELSYKELFDYTLRIRTYFTDAFDSVLSGYMSYFLGNMKEIIGTR